MTLPNDANRYDVRETEQFDVEWRHAVRLGYINPMVDPAALMQIRQRLERSPYSIQQSPNVPANTRRAGLNSQVQLWYSIIEDDRTVWLESVRIVGETEPTPP